MRMLGKHSTNGAVFPALGGIPEGISNIPSTPSPSYALCYAQILFLSQLQDLCLQPHCLQVWPQRLVDCVCSPTGSPLANLFPIGCLPQPACTAGTEGEADNYLMSPHNADSQLKYP